MKCRADLPEAPFPPIPSVLIAFYNASGEPQIVPGAWMGIVCSRPAVLFLTMKGAPEDPAGFPIGGSFSVNLPREELLVLPGVRELQVTGDISPLALFGLKLKKGLASPAPVIDGCPIRIECRQISFVNRFSEEAVSGEVLAVQADEKIYGLDAPVDLCRLKSFMQRARSAGLPVIPSMADIPQFGERVPDAG